MQVRHHLRNFSKVIFKGEYGRIGNVSIKVE